MVGRANVGSTAQMQSVMATAEVPHRERATAPIQRANASLSGLRAGRALKPAAGPSHPIGFYAHGCLEGGVALPLDGQCGEQQRSVEMRGVVGDQDDRALNER